jgi:hypothetical protein
MVDVDKTGGPPAPRRRAPLTGRQVVAQVAVAAVILVSGIAIGGGGTILALKDRIIPRPIQEASAGGAVPMQDPNELGRHAGRIVERWQVDYGLSEEQTQRARQTLASEFATTAELHRKFQTAERTQREKFAQAIKEILTPEQYERWDGDFRRMVEHMERMRPVVSRRGGRGGPPGERRPDWSPERLDPNDPRGPRPAGPPRDPNFRRWDGPRPRPMGPDGQRGDGPPGPPRDPESRRGDWPRDRAIEPNNLSTN